jgi:hypothetical protein
MLPDASGFTELAVPICCWAFEAVDSNVNNAASATAGIKLRICIACLP